MFLMRKTPIALARERGSSLLAVIGLMAVAGVATLAIAGSTMNSVGVSSATRAGVQAQAAAEGGIDAALLKLTTAACEEAFSTSAPVSAVTIAQSISETGDSWTAGCPIPTSLRVKVLSTGAAANAGVAGNSTGDARTVEAVYRMLPESTATTAPASALYSYSMGNFAGSSQLHAGNGAKPIVQVKTGNVTCDITDIAATGIFNADFVVAAGGVEVGKSCQIKGNVWTTQAVYLHGSAQVTGNIVAPSVKFINSSIIHGSVWTSGATVLETSAWIKGSVTAGSLSMINSAKIDQDAWSAGATSIGHTTNTITGHLTTKSLTNSGPGTITGGTTIVPGGPASSTGTGAGSAPAPAPTVPEWVDVGYDTSLWDGYDEVKADGCGFFDIDHQIQRLKKPTIIDARDCEGGVVLSPEKGTVKLKLPKDVDVVIYADKFSLLGDAVISGKSKSLDNKLWLITPDETVGDGPTCLSSESENPDDSSIRDSFMLESSVAAFIYTPCALNMGFSAQWNGQFYGGSVSTTGSSQLTYDALGIPNSGLSVDVAPGTGASDSKLGDRMSIRDLNG